MKICERCSKEHDGSYGSGRFCSSTCANTRVHSNEIKLKIKESVLDYNKRNNLKIYDEVGNKRLIKCKICGCIECLRPDVCSKRQLFPTLSKYFNFNTNLIGSVDIYVEWDRIKSIIDNDYNILNLSSIEIAKKYNYYDAANMCGILTRLGIVRRNHSQSNILAISESRIKLPVFGTCYKHGWHTTWDNKQVYFRSNLEKIICEYLDDKHIIYEVETKRIKYWSSIKNSFHISIPDFYIPKYNLLVEVKGLYFYNEIDINDRKKSYLENGYQFRLYLENQKVIDVLGDLI